MRTLILGAGLVGSHIGRSLLERGVSDVTLVDHRSNTKGYAKQIAGDAVTVDVLERGINDSAQAKQLLLKHQPDALVVSAGSMAVHYSAASGLAVANEATLTWSVAQAANEVRCVQHLVFVSSFAVYGSETDTDESVIPNPRTAYGIVKLYNEHIYRRAYGRGSLTIVRPCGILGPPPPNGGGWMSKHLLQLLKDPCCPSLLSETFCDGIDWLDARDLAGLITTLIERPSETSLQIVNVGRGEVTSPSQLASALAEISGRSFVARPTVRLRSPISSNKAFSTYGFTPRWNLLETLRYVMQQGESR